MRASFCLESSMANPVSHQLFDTYFSIDFITAGASMGGTILPVSQPRSDGTPVTQSASNYKAFSGKSTSLAGPATN
jgi:hypothetical protein